MLTQGEKEKSLNRLYKLKKEILKSDNDVLVSQIDHAILKTYKNQLVLSFIGHYSAGKSSLINHLLQRDILPSSPVPTTSNTVAVEISNENLIEAFINQYQYAVVDNYDDLKHLNTKDLDIEAINMEIVHDDYKEGTVFQDTPGVDSNTQSHEDSANRFLLNSDVIFFTVEYNHVESEHNLRLLKEISELDIPLILIINQIDKHDDHELSMDTFLQRVRKTLKSWQIAEEDIYTTSIYESKYNQVDDLKNFILNIEKQKASRLNLYDQRIRKNIEDKQLAYLKDQVDALEEDLKLEHPLSIEKCQERISYLDKELKEARAASIRQDPEELESYIKEQVKKLVKDAYIFPHQVKSAITDYLKVLSGDEKVSGLFGKKKKEAQLKNERLEKINDVMQPVLDTEINANVNSLYTSLGLIGPPYKYIWHNENLNHDAITSLNKNFISNYFDRLSSKLMTDISKEAADFIKQLKVEESSSNQGYTALTSEKELYESAAQYLTLIESLTTQNYQHLYIHMDDEIDKLNLTEEIELSVEDSEKAEEEKSRHNIFTVNKSSQSLQSYKEVVSLLKDQPTYSSYHNIFTEKINRLESGKANISVFGGFSAGKTTFINALLGQHYLTTSPNPTTATITEINDQETSRAIYKSESDLIEVLETLSGLSYSSIKDYESWIKKHINQVEETYKPLLSGLLNKYEDYQDVLGRTVDIDKDHLISMISSDEDATFVHKADVSIKNKLTESYTLIDSPGINSINQRHTSETSDIIASSDMIIYVSYYNHVFSRSDETFLKYIQSIKGQDFPIIFIINAVDLMRSEDDKNKVINYMASSLDKLGIKHVIYPVSSKKALTSSDQGFDLAKENIMKLAKEEARAVQIKSLKELKDQLLSNIESNMRQFEDSGQERQKIINDRQDLQEFLTTFNLNNLQDSLNSELDIILTYLPKRLDLQLYDYLKGLLTVSDMKDKAYIKDNLSLLERKINDYLTLEANIAFNAVYRQADSEVTQTLTTLNEKISQASLANHFTIEKSTHKEAQLEIDASVLTNYDKTLNKAINKPKVFRDALLDLSQSLIQTIDISHLQSQLEDLIHDYLKTQDQSLEADKDELQRSLQVPLKEISQEDYEKDKVLYQELKDIKE